MTEGTNRMGVHYTGLIFEKIGYIFREQTVSDYGIDAIVEKKYGDKPSGKLLALQIKTGESYFKEIKDNKVIYRGDMSHYYYWVNHSLPVIIVLCNPEKNICIFNYISEDTVEFTNENWKIEISLDNTLENNVNILDKILNQQTDYQNKYTSLALAKQLMEYAEEYKLILLVDEWINKSSGKGDFSLYYEDKDGNEILISEDTYFGIGLRPYNEAIKDIYPWANIHIDYEFYQNYNENENIRYDYENNQLIDDCVQNQENNEIYAYGNSAGEVDHYRLVLELNEIGKAFLLLDNFLNNSHMYIIN